MNQWRDKNVDRDSVIRCLCLNVKFSCLIRNHFKGFERIRFHKITDIIKVLTVTCERQRGNCETWKNSMREKTFGKRKGRRDFISTSEDV